MQIRLGILLPKPRHLNQRRFLKIASQPLAQCPEYGIFTSLAFSMYLHFAPTTPYSALLMIMYIYFQKRRPRICYMCNHSIGAGLQSLLFSP